MANNSLALLDENEIAGIDDVDLPALYKQACQALEQCYEIDECKDWVDKSAAFKVYAKQLKNEAFVKTAMKIQGRAARQCGICLQAIKAQSSMNALKKREDGNDLSFSRTEAARDAGLSERQQKTSMRVANIPREEFETLIESEKPPTVTKLAEIGTKVKPRPLVDFYAEGITEYEFQQAIRLRGFLDDIIRECPSLDVPAGIKGTMKKLVPGMLEDAQKAKQIINQFLGYFDV